MIETTEPTHEGTTPGTPGVSWPPPGLERLQNGLAPLVRSTWLAALVFTIPLMFALRPRSNSSLLLIPQLPFLPTRILATVGFVLVFVAAIRLALVLNEMRRGAELGYGGGLLLSVAADRRHDTGTLINGARLFEGFPIDGRKQLQLVRIMLPVALLASAWWLAIGFAIAGVLAYLGALGWIGLLAFTLVPTVILLFGAIVVRALEGSLLKQAVKGWSTRAALHEVTRTDAAEWQTELDESGALEATAGGAARLPTGLTWAVTALAIAGALALTIPLRVVRRAPTNVMNPYSAMFGDETTLLGRRRAAELLRRYALPGDSSATPQQAGEALHTLASIGMTQRGAGGPPTSGNRAPLREPKRVLPSVLPEGPENRLLGPPEMWSTTLFDWVKRGLTVEQRQLLARIAAQPIGEEIQTIIDAPGIDIVGTRWTVPFPEDLPAVYLTRPFRGVQEFSYARIATAALQFANGEQAAAEHTLRAMMTVGFRLADDGPMSNDTYNGTSLVSTGARVLAHMYRAAGRQSEAEPIEAGIAMAPGFTFGERSVFREEWFLSAGQRPGIPESLRWISFADAQAVATCGSLHQLVFRNDERMAFRLRRAREELVKYPSDAALFDVMKHGWFGPERGPMRCSNRSSVMRNFRDPRR